MKNVRDIQNLLSSHLSNSYVNADQISVGRSLEHQQVLGRSLNNLCKNIQEKEGFCKLNPNF